MRTPANIGIIWVILHMMRRAWPCAGRSRQAIRQALYPKLSKTRSPYKYPGPLILFFCEVMNAVHQHTQGLFNRPKECVLFGTYRVCRGREQPPGPPPTTGVHQRDRLLLHNTDTNLVVLSISLIPRTSAQHVLQRPKSPVLLPRGDRSIATGQAPPSPPPRRTRQS